MTVEVASGRFNIGTRDQEMFRRESDVIFNRDLGTSNYHSAHGSVRGVMITRVAPRLSNYGVRSGDIVTAINGEAVRSKTEAIRVAKRLYRRGVRTFEVEFQRRGQLVRTGGRLDQAHAGDGQRSPVGLRSLIAGVEVPQVAEQPRQRDEVLAAMFGQRARRLVSGRWIAGRRRHEQQRDDQRNGRSAHAGGYVDLSSRV